MAYLQKLYCGQDSDCVNILRMNKDVFFKLCTKLRSMGALRDTWQCSVEEQLAMFLQTVGHKKKNRDIKFHFTRSTETFSRCFNEVLYAIGQLGPEMLRNRSTDVPSKIQKTKDSTLILRIVLVLLMEPTYPAMFLQEWQIVFMVESPSQPKMC